MSGTSHSSITKAMFGSFVAVSMCCGCGGGKPWDTVYQTKGVVKHKGKPVKDAEIRFFPVNSEYPESVRPWAKSNENGEFAVSTYNREDGAPTGAYKVTVVHHEIVVKGDSMMSKPNSLPKKYAAKDTTDLTVDIGRGQTTIPPLELK